MNVHEVTFITNISLTVTVRGAEDEGVAEDAAYSAAFNYVETVWGDGRDVSADVSLDGVSAHSVKLVSGDSGGGGLS